MPIRLYALLALALALAAPVALAETTAPSSAVLEALNGPQALPDITEGKPDAPVTIIEYASLTCSHCAAFHKDVWPALKAKYIDTGKAKLTLREFPLDTLALGAFMLARCAGPDKRNAVVDRLFDNQAIWAFAANPLYKLKEQLIAAGMSEADFDACLKNQALYDQVKAMHEAASAKLGVSSTPTFFVNGQKLTGEQTLDKLEEVLGPLTK